MIGWKEGESTVIRRYEAPMYRALLTVLGDHIHPGHVEGPDDSWEDAALRADGCMASQADFRPGDVVLETACGVGGTAQFLAQSFDIEILATNIVECQLDIARERTALRGLGDRIRYEIADFHKLQYRDASFDAYWCQDSLVHAIDRQAALSEAFRVLKLGRRAIVSDLVVVGDMDKERKRRFAEVVAAPDMWSNDRYRQGFAAAGFELLLCEDWTGFLRAACQRSIDVINDGYDVMVQIAGAEEVDKTLERFEVWFDGANRGYCGWTLFVARKPG